MKKVLMALSLFALSACVIACVNDPTLDDTTMTEESTDTVVDEATQTVVETSTDTASSTEVETGTVVE